ncbi:uncharacterized protein F5891DRAFT_1202569 [Suillus fuscotomentosus]|uniref:Glycosyl hydrolase family 13 catalytic domain-containing protein n=1 Tax=Suillus fuscotomentosus TaxID=1912939 RepID=A0AAD4DN54_9AGAM|nr:uncharacterized protein F5891DRAFT_1202569 [Suillus fuscotomentosus]KAG1884512.1 hypothetical protein F5891DRAFT_1202569 [Suillus fuscotomentosus]
MDVINCISKTDGLPDAPLVDHTQYYQPTSRYYVNGPQVHKYMKQMHTKVLSPHDLITIGETPFTHEASELATKPWMLRELKAIVGRWQQFMHDDGFWNAINIENYDQARSVSRFGNDSVEWPAVSAKMLAIFEVHKYVKFKDY